MRKLITATIAVFILFTLNVSSAFADVNPYGPYNPYKPHKPIPTGFEDTTIFYIAAVALFIVGMSVLAIVKILKAKQSLR